MRETRNFFLFWRRPHNGARGEVFAGETRVNERLSPQSHPLLGVRAKEARLSGPLVRMPGDGHRPYHALGWWSGLSAFSMRDAIADAGEPIWRDATPWAEEKERTAV